MLKFLAAFIAMSFDQAINYLGERPKVGMITSFSGFFSSFMISPDVQAIILFCLQVLALLTSLVVSILTIIGWFRKQKSGS